MPDVEFQWVMVRPPQVRRKSVNNSDRRFRASVQFGQPTHQCEPAEPTFYAPTGFVSQEGGIGVSNG